MSHIAVNDNLIVVTKGLYIDCYEHNHDHHKIISIDKCNSPEDNHISDIAVSSDNKYLAAITSSSKLLVIYSFPALKEERSFVLPRSASKIRFAINNTQILVADKTGDGLIYNIQKDDSGTKLLGHLSLLLNILQTPDTNFIITSDRDEKIRVTCYPNTYNIHTYCLGHKEYVDHIELLPHNNKYLISTSGDGTIKCWNYEKGLLCHTIDTSSDIKDENLKKEFRKNMDEDGLEVERLPVVHFSTVKLNDSHSLIAITVYLVKKIFLYSIQTENEQFRHKLLETLDLENFPSAIIFNNLNLFIYFDASSEVIHYKVTINLKSSFDLVKKLSMFKDVDMAESTIFNRWNSMSVLFKRKFDNMQEYQERKKKRLGISE